LVKRMRSVSPPMETRSTWRTELLASPELAGRPEGVGGLKPLCELTRGSGAVAQVATHLVAPVCAVAMPTARSNSNAVNAAREERRKVIGFMHTAILNHGAETNPASAKYRCEANVASNIDPV